MFSGIMCCVCIFGCVVLQGRTRSVVCVVEIVVYMACKYEEDGGGVVELLFEFWKLGIGWG